MPRGRFRVLTGPVAGHPVARAVARAKLSSHLTTAKLRLYTMEAGSDHFEQLSGLMAALLVIVRALELQYAGQEMPRDILRDTRVLRGGLSALHQTIRRWDPMQAVAIEQAIDAAERLNKLARVEHVTTAGREAGLL